MRGSGTLGSLLIYGALDLVGTYDGRQEFSTYRVLAAAVPQADGDGRAFAQIRRGSRRTATARSCCRRCCARRRRTCRRHAPRRRNRPQALERGIPAGVLRIRNAQYRRVLPARPAPRAERHIDLPSERMDAQSLGGRVEGRITAAAPAT
jgi:hypothetical protein